MKKLLLPLLPTLLFTLGCGPMTLWSSCFPLEYSVSTRVNLREGDKTTSQERISSCSVVNQTDSIAKNYNAAVVSERHALPTADGGMLLFADLRPCRWYESDKLPEPDLRFSFVPGRRGDISQGTLPLVETEAWWIDDPKDPKRLEVWHSDGLFDGVGRFAATADIAVTEGEVTRTLRTEVPWLEVQWAAEKAKRAAAADKPELRVWPNPANPSAFDGIIAEVYRLENGATCAGVPDESGVVLLARNDDCRSMTLCRGGRTGPCARLMGGLVPEVSADGVTVRFTTSEPRAGWMGSLPRRDQLPPGAPAQRNLWTPTVCVDARCTSVAEPESTSIPLRAFDVYIPAAAIRVNVHGLQRELGVWDLAPGTELAE